MSLEIVKEYESAGIPLEIDFRRIVCEDKGTKVKYISMQMDSALRCEKGSYSIIDGVYCSNLDALNILEETIQEIGYVPNIRMSQATYEFEFFRSLAYIEDGYLGSLLKLFKISANSEMILYIYTMFYKSIEERTIGRERVFDIKKDSIKKVSLFLKKEAQNPLEELSSFLRKEVKSLYGVRLSVEDSRSSEFISSQIVLKISPFLSPLKGEVEFYKELYVESFSTKNFDLIGYAFYLIKERHFTVEKARSMISIHKMRSRIEGAKFALGGDYYTTSIKKILFNKFKIEENLLELEKDEKVLNLAEGMDLDYSDEVILEILVRSSKE